MVAALVADACRDGGFETTLLVDAERPLVAPDPVRCLPVSPGDELASLAAEAVRADATIVIAPETAGVLQRRVREVRIARGRPLASEEPFIAVAADKQATVHALAAAGVPVPAGRLLAAGEPWPSGFRLPAVRKALASAGGDGVVIVQPGDQPPSTVAEPTRIEAFVAGLPVGVSCIAGPAGIWPLPPVRQVFDGSPPRYVGGERIGGAGLCRRAERLALRAVRAVARAAGGAAPAGWLGVDMILGNRDDGRDDRVLEVNPRLTSSFVGLARWANVSLVRSLVDASCGHEPRCGIDVGAGEAAFRISDAAHDRTPPR